MTSVLFIVLGAVVFAGGVVAFLLRARLVATMMLAAGALAGVSGWLLTDPAVTRAEALKTGGLAAGSVVALYALWLNDRRRRVDEDRQQLEHERQVLESARAEHDRERAADERFLRAVELLGNDADQVRVGALHALAGIARGRPEYTQDVLDVICSYLRRPFDHPDYARARDELREGWDTDVEALREADRWRQVRLTAQRLIADLLPEVGDPDAERYDLDLHGATLEYCDLSGRVIGQLRARSLRLYGSNAFHHCEIHGPAWFTGGESWGRLFMQDTVFHERSWFSRFRAHAWVDFTGTVFHGDTKFAGGVYRGPVSFAGARFAHNVDFEGTAFHDGLDLRVEGGELTGQTYGMTVSLEHVHHLPAGWHVDSSRGGTSGLVRG